ncbi:hypothetical protein AAGR22_08575 [Erwinia sp. HDF1-3R]|uniref:hypothetical protein n=1 Tax=Erwinia sp. HDF1-3R TaxID=3141543 RepID=UPI0031F47E06
MDNPSGLRAFRSAAAKTEGQARAAGMLHSKSGSTPARDRAVRPGVGAKGTTQRVA